MERTCKATTIRDLINSLKEVMVRNPNITWDSELIISDLDLSFFGNDCKLFPTYDYKDRKTKLGIYVIRNKIEDEEEPQPIKQQVKPLTKNTTDTEWLNKYKG